jgi:hypothetical protein
LIFVKGQKGEKRTGAWSKASDHLQDTRSSLGWKNIKSKKTFGEYVSLSLSTGGRRRKGTGFDG